MLVSPSVPGRTASPVSTLMPGTMPAGQGSETELQWEVGRLRVPDAAQPKRGLFLQGPHPTCQFMRCTARHCRRGTAVHRSQCVHFIGGARLHPAGS